MSGSKLQRHLFAAVASVLMSTLVVGTTIAPSDAIAASPVSASLIQGGVYA